MRALYCSGLECVLCQRASVAHTQVCDPCRETLDWRLGDIVELYALLPDLLEPGADAGRPKVSGSRDAPLPVRLDVLTLTGPGDDAHDVEEVESQLCQVGSWPVQVMLRSWEADIRHTRALADPDQLAPLAALMAGQLRWLAGAAAQRGDCRTLRWAAQYLVWLRPRLHAITDISWPLTGTVAFLRRHLPWMCEQYPAVADFAAEVTGVHNGLRDACREHRPKLLGTCTRSVLRDGEQVECGARLYASTYSDTISCWGEGCGASWDRAEWKRLGRSMGLLPAGERAR